MTAKEEITFRTKNVPAFIKSFEPEEGIVKGYAAVGGFQDSYGDIIEPGAFKRTLKEHKDRIRLCWMHNFREPIGKPHVLQEHDRDHLPEELLAKYPKATCGLYFESKIVDTRQGADAKVLIREGVVEEMSIGWDAYENGEHLDDKGQWHLTDIILYEISPVTMAAMPAAGITDYKMRLKPEETEDYIRIPIEGVSCEITATIDIDKDKGIKGLYCGKEKKVRTLLFDKSKGWTMESAKKWYEEHKEDFKTALEVNFKMILEFKGVIPYKQTPKAPEDADWDGPREVAAADVDDLKVMCTYFANEGENKGDFKLPHHQAEGQHPVVWRGVAAVMGGHGGVDLPSDAVSGVKTHLGKHYKEFDKEPPWEKAARAIGLIEDYQFDEATQLLTELSEELSSQPSLTGLGQKETLALEIGVCEAELEALSIGTD